MRAAIMRRKKLIVDELPTPEPGPGEVLVELASPERHAKILVEPWRS